MKIFYYTCVQREGHERYGGAITVAWDTVDLLRDAGVEVIVGYYLDWNRWTGSVWELDIDGEKIAAKSFENILEKYEPSVILLNDILRRTDYRKAHKLAIPIIQEVHGPCYPSTLKHRIGLPIRRRWKEFFWELRHRFMCRYATSITRPSGYAKGTVISNYRVRESIVKVLYNSVNLELYSPSKRQLELGPTDHCVFINAGRMAPNRNFLECIEIFTRVVTTYPLCELVLAGDGHQMELCKKQVEEKGIPNVTFLGSVSRSELAEHYSGADILLNTSEFETFGCVLAEAMATGLPILAYKATAIPEVAPDKEVGFLSEVNDINSHVNHATELVQDPALRLTMGRKGRARAEELFSEAAKAKSLQRLFEEVTTQER